MQDVADAEIDGDRIPGRADAERVNMAIGDAVDHVGRRQHHKPDILIRIDATGGHPEPELIVVGGERKRHAEGERLGAGLATFSDHARQSERRGHRVEAAAFELGHDGGVQGRGHRDRVAVHPESEGGHDRDLDMADAEAGGDCNRRQQMRRIEQADIQLVAHIRPRDLAHQRDVQTFRGGVALVDRDDERRGIDQRNEANANRPDHFSISEAVRIDCAISPIFFFSRIAVERNST